MAATLLMALSGAAAMVEMTYHLQLNSSQGSELVFLGTTLNVASAQSWFGAALVALVGFGLFELTRRRFAFKWKEIQEFIEKKMNPENAE